MEITVLPEMEIAGQEAMREARIQRLTDAETAVAVYMAMRAVYAMYLLQNSESIH